MTPAEGVPTTREATRARAKERPSPSQPGPRQRAQEPSPAGRSKNRPQAATARTIGVALRRVDPWSVLKASLVFYVSLCVTLLTAGVLLWAGAQTVGVVGNVESFMDGIGFNDFSFDAARLLQGSALGGFVLVAAGTLGNFLLALLYNLIAELVGGIRVVLSSDEEAGSRRREAERR